MSHIDVCARHNMSRNEAQSAADELAQDLAGKFDIEYEWEGDHIHFDRPGVHGTIAFRENEIHVNARLGMMLMFLKPQIEREVTRYLQDHFDCTIA